MEHSPFLLRNLDYLGVELFAGRWRRQFEENGQWLLALDENRLLRTFRDKAGIASDVPVYPGWYGKNGATFGQYVTAMCKMYHITRDVRYKAKVLRLLNGWAETLSEDGHPNYAGDSDCYPFDKLLTALLDADAYLGWTQALPLALKISLWAEKNFDVSVPRDGIETPALDAAGMMEWWTLPEMLVRAYERTGNQLYRKLACMWSYDYMWDKLAKGDENIGLRHAYSHANSLCSAAAMYKLTGEKHYLDAAIGGYNLIFEKHTYATGGFGPAETLFGEDGYLGDSVLAPDQLAAHSDFKPFWGGTPRDDVWGNCEISCCSWAVMKLTHYLLSFTGEAKYAEWAERMIFNCLGGQPPLTPEGEVLYYARYFVNGAVKNVRDRRMHSDGAQNKWQCCTGTFPQCTSEYYNLLYYQSEDALYIAQYMPSRVRIDNLTFCVETEYPRKGDISIYTDAPEGGLEHTLLLRVPAFAKGHGEKLLINGSESPLSYNAQGWLQIRRRWQSGDCVQLHLPFSLCFEAIDKKHPDICALFYGPLVLAGNEFMLLQGDKTAPEQWIVQEDPEALVFRTLPGHDVKYDFLTDVFQPYMDIPRNQWYFLYNEVRT